jgi:hypothetical protein
MSSFELMNVANVGSACLGVVIGWTTRFFLYRFKEFDPKSLSATLSPMLGGGVVGFFSWISTDRAAVWFYPIGLLIGFVIYSATYSLIHWKSTGETARNLKGGVYYAQVPTKQMPPETDEET